MPVTSILSPEVLSEVTIDLLPSITGLTEENFWRFLNWHQDEREAERRIIERFKPTIFSRTGYSDENRPAGEVEDVVRVQYSDLEFLVKTKSTTKKPGYKQVNVEFGDYLRFLLERYQQGVQQKGVLTVNDEPYVLVDNLIGKLERDLENILEGKEGISQSLTCPPQPSVDRLTIELARDYSKFIVENAMAFIAASQLLEHGSENYKVFKDLLEDSSLEVLGGKPATPVVVTYPFEHAVFRHHLDPRITVKYAEIINTALLKDPTERITRRSRIGDLKLARLVKDEVLAQTLREKDLLDPEFILDYHPIIRDGQVYVRLEGVISRLEAYNGDLTSYSLNPSFSVRRV